MEDKQLRELLIQALEHERGGVRLYEAAVECAENEDLRAEWKKYLSQTRHHVEVLEGLFPAFGLDLADESPGRGIAAAMGRSLLEAIASAVATGDRTAAQIVAAECITLAETQDHLNWELLGECAGKLKGEPKQRLQAAYEEIEDQEDEHLYHTRGWCRELWLESLGLKAVLPPPEERRHVKTAIAAARAEKSGHSRKH